MKRSLNPHSSPIVSVSLLSPMLLTLLTLLMPLTLTAMIPPALMPPEGGFFVHLLHVLPEPVAIPE